MPPAGPSGGRAPGAAGPGAEEAGRGSRCRHRGSRLARPAAAAAPAPLPPPRLPPPSLLPSPSRSALPARAVLLLSPDGSRQRHAASRSSSSSPSSPALSQCHAAAAPPGTAGRLPATLPGLEPLGGCRRAGGAGPRALLAPRQLLRPLLGRPRDGPRRGSEQGGRQHRKPGHAGCR